MSRPEVSGHTERVYAGLPEAYRDADAGLDDGEVEGASNGYPLLRFASLIGDQAGAVEDLVDRIDDTDAHPSELFDPVRSDPAWRPWAQQLAAARARASTGALLDTVRVRLTPGGGQAPRVLLSRPGPFELLVETYAAQTPDPGAAEAAAREEKPAGIGLAYAVRGGGTYADLTEHRLTYAQVLARSTTEIGAMVPRV